MPFNFHRHFTGNNAVLLRLHGNLGLQRNIFFAKQVDAFFNRAQVGKILPLVQLFYKGVFNQLAIELIGIGLDLGLYLQYKILKGLFQCFVFGIAGHADLAPGGIFANHGFQLAHVAQPGFHVGSGAVSRCSRS